MARGKDTSKHSNRKVDKASMITKIKDNLGDDAKNIYGSQAQGGQPSCPECNKTYTKDDYYGHDCEV